MTQHDRDLSLEMNLRCSCCKAVTYQWQCNLHKYVALYIYPRQGSLTGTFCSLNLNLPTPYTESHNQTLLSHIWLRYCKDCHWLRGLQHLLAYMKCLPPAFNSSRGNVLSCSVMRVCVCSRSEMHTGSLELQISWLGAQAAPRAEWSFLRNSKMTSWWDRFYYLKHWHGTH